MDKSPQFSIIIPCHNDKAWVGNAIESCLKQTHLKREVIVIDDGSTDGSPQWLADQYKNNKDVKLIFTKNLGPSSARNRGLAESTGTHVIFLDSDDMLGPTQLSVLSQTISGRKHLNCAALLITPFAYFTERFDQPSYLLMKRFSPPRLHPKNKIINKLLILTGNCFPISSCALSRELLNKAGGFDPSLRWHEDWDFWIRIVSEADTVTYTPNILEAATQIRCRTGLMSNREKMLKSRQEVLTRHTQKIPWTLLRFRPFWFFFQLTRILAAYFLNLVYGRINRTAAPRDGRENQSTQSQGEPLP